MQIGRECTEVTQRAQSSAAAGSKAEPVNRRVQPPGRNFRQEVHQAGGSSGGRLYGWGGFKGSVRGQKSNKRAGRANGVVSLRKGKRFGEGSEAGQGLRTGYVAFQPEYSIF